MAAYLYFLAKKRGEAKKITDNEREMEQNREQQQAYLLISTIFAGATGLNSFGFSEALKEFKRFQKALRALK
jgi:hypothetical protein